MMRKEKHKSGFWISLLIPLYFGVISIAYRFSQTAIVQDDQRLHLVWLQQWHDPTLFPNDLIAQYYQSIQPIGFRAFYWGAAQIGINPMLLGAVLPLILAMISSVVLYRVTVRLLPHALAPILTVLIFNQNIWGKDDLVSASPRSFAYLLLILFLDALVGLNQQGQKSLRWSIWCLIVLVLQGLFYPQIMLVSLGVLWLQLLQWQNGKIRLSKKRSRYGLAIAGLILSGIVLLLFSQNASAFGEIYSAATMRSMPEFQPGGRRVYFGVSPLRFWFGGASGLRFPLFPPILWAAIGLPFLVRSQMQSQGQSQMQSQGQSQEQPQSRSRFAAAVKPEVSLLAQVLIAALGWFGLAHLTLPLLYLPSRYTFYSSRVVMAIAAGITLALWIDRFWQWVRLRRSNGLRLGDRIKIAAVGLFAIAAAILPAIPPLFLSNQGWVTSSNDRLYAFLANQPPSSMIASLSPVTDNIPALARRSVLFSPELAMPYHEGFYREMQQRISDLIQAQYSSDASTIKSTIEKYSISLWIFESNSFAPGYLLSQSWLINSSMRSIALKTVTASQQVKAPVLQTLSQKCAVFSENAYLVTDMNCVLQHLNSNPNS